MRFNTVLPAIGLCALLFVQAAECGGLEGRWQIRTDSASLVLDFHHQPLLDDVMAGLSEGLTSAFEVEVQLWKESGFPADVLLEEKQLRMKLSYDIWEKSYEVHSREGKRPVNREKLRQLGSGLHDLHVAWLYRLVPGERYRIVYRAWIRPMSLENVADVGKWLAGEAKQLNPGSAKKSGSPVRKIGNWMLRFMLNATGFGDRVMTAKSPKFGIRDGRIVLEGDS
ncbi:DUF4390 domain-containing protein [bacterium]|nr:DUF4390 domain-containing protein [bacterium]